MSRTDFPGIPVEDDYAPGESEAAARAVHDDPLFRERLRDVGGSGYLPEHVARYVARPAASVAVEAERARVRGRVEEWLGDNAYAPNDIVLGADPEATVRDLLDLVCPTWRGLFAENSR
jgi:hypothetical protein